MPPRSTVQSPPAVLIALPKGAILSGITAWAGSLARGLAASGHRVMVLVHATPDAPDGGTPLDLSEGGGVEVRRLTGVPPIDEALPEPRPELVAYRSAVGDLHRASGGPVVVLPTYSAECFGLFAAVSREMPGVVRTVGWMHSDIPYDRLTLRHYEPLIHRFVGVSSEMVAGLRGALPGRVGDITQIPYGVPIPACPARRPGPVGGPARPVRLVYTGRMDREQKRVHALVGMSRELERVGIGHELVLVGDGPGASAIDEMIGGTACVRRVRASPGEVGGFLAWADVFVLASRYEGLSVSMIEAMASGCVPVVTRVSGAADGVGADRVTSCGEIVDAGPGVDEPGLGALMAGGVAAAIRRGLGGLSLRARERAVERFSGAAMASAVSALCAACAKERGRAWPERRPAISGDFTVPVDAIDRAGQMLARLRGRRVALWGAGRHTRAIARSLGHDLAGVVAVLDDGVIPAGARLGRWPVVRPCEAGAMGITDVVISSALHEEALWARRAEIESDRLRVHRLYDDGGVESAPRWGVLAGA